MKPAESVMPEPMLEGNNTTMPFQELIGPFETGEYADLFLNDKHTGRTVMGRPLPPFQRDLVWVREQEVRFIESVWLNFDIGSLVLTDCDTYGAQDRETAEGYTNLVIDGQQRLQALEHYITDRFPVFGYHWSELPKVDQRRFKMHAQFPTTTLREFREEVLRELYNRLNYAGTPHTEAERA